jgi:hypothetical protein
MEKKIPQTQQTNKTKKGYSNIDIFYAIILGCDHIHNTAVSQPKATPN